MDRGPPITRTSHRSRQGVLSHRCLRKARAANTVITGLGGSAGIAEAYVIAGHKGQPEVVKNKGRKGRRRRRKGKGGRGTLKKERPPVFGMMQRGGEVVINLLANVQ